jgi:hypothetical protein
LSSQIPDEEDEIEIKAVVKNPRPIKVKRE